MKSFFHRATLIAQGLFFLAATALLLTLGLRAMAGWPDDGARRELAHAQLVGLDDALRHRDAAGKMQQVFPEGACFVETLHVLAWAELARQSPGDAALRQEALEAIRWTLDQYASAKVGAPVVDTQVKEGVFFCGQRNLMLARYLELLAPAERPAPLEAEFHARSAELAAAFLASPTHHLDSYESMCWPADNSTALASLLVHDKLYQTDDRQAYDAWKQWTRAHLDPGTGLPAGKLDSKTGLLQEPARGCANSWICGLLREFDPEFAAELYRADLKHFGLRRLGFQMFREYPVDRGREADVDSGPIIWGAGVVATGVGLGAASAQGDFRTAADIQALSGIFGWPTRWTIGERPARRDLLGYVPVGDAFLAWSLSLPPGPQSSAPPSLFARLAGRTPFFGVLALLEALLCLRFYREIRRKRQRRHAERDASAGDEAYDPKIAADAPPKDLRANH